MALLLDITGVTVQAADDSRNPANSGGDLVVQNTVQAKSDGGGSTFEWHGPSPSQIVEMIDDSGLQFLWTTDQTAEIIDNSGPKFLWTPDQTAEIIDNNGPKFLWTTDQTTEIIDNNGPKFLWTPDQTNKIIDGAPPAAPARPDFNSIFAGGLGKREEQTSTSFSTSQWILIRAVDRSKFEELVKGAGAVPGGGGVIYNNQPSGGGGVNYGGSGGSTVPGGGGVNPYVPGSDHGEFFGSKAPVTVKVDAPASDTPGWTPDPYNGPKSQAELNAEGGTGLNLSVANLFRASR